MTSATILDGRALAAQIRARLRERVQVLGAAPRLDVVVASQDPASVAYVRMKRRWAAEIGIEGDVIEVGPETRQADLLAEIARLNADPAVHGVLIQHPLPPLLDEPAILMALDAEKDVDGLTPLSLGRLVSRLPGFRCATPLGIVTLLDHYGIELKGKRALVIGRSVILGKPAALMLLARNATVTIAHRWSVDLDVLCGEAEIVVAAVGKPNLVRGAWLRPGCVVVDAGYNKVDGRDVGDVAFEEAVNVASYITPVPGGVGPMTVVSLLSNVVDAAEERLASAATPGRASG